MTVAAFVISVLAVLAATAAALYARQQAQAARDAVDEAKRSSDAAERSAVAAERSVELSEAEAAKYSPPWDLRWASGDTYLLTNDSDEATLDVKIDLGDIHVVRGQLEHERIGPGSAVKFLAARTMNVSNDTVTVTWRRLPDGPTLEWSHPLPAKPR